MKKSSTLRTCVTPAGTFVWGLHRPAFQVSNRRSHAYPAQLGTVEEDGRPVTNDANFPSGDLSFPAATPIYEIANPLAFRGTTFIGKNWADRTAEDPQSIRLPRPPAASFHDLLDKWFPDADHENRFADLPEAVLLALAVTSSDRRDLVLLARMSCAIDHDADGQPVGLRYRRDQRGRLRPVFYNKPLFEALVNNPYLPDMYKEVMVLRPGVQGDSPIVGEWHDQRSHVFEYLRSNSYIPWGHYAANMANDAIRYRLADLSRHDMRAMRHLYYQRTYLRLATELGIDPPSADLDERALESLRQTVVKRLRQGDTTTFTATLWGWNYGFDYTPTHYRLHASHQQIHQQFAMVPDRVDGPDGALPAFACGDMVADFCLRFREIHGRDFFDCYLAAIRANRRMDGRTDRSASLIVWEDEQVMLFVPKAQTSQWELQLVTVPQVGNIVEADTSMRASLDQGSHTALTALTRLGARMVTSIEFSGRLDTSCPGQRLLYSFLPKLPQSMGAFSEAQLRWINGHYPEDFAHACRTAINNP